MRCFCWEYLCVVCFHFLLQLRHLPAANVTDNKWLSYVDAYQWPLPECDKPAAGPVEDFTLVTALIDLDRDKWPHFRQDLDYYLTHAVPLLNLNVPMVIFVDTRFRDFIHLMRKNKPHLTSIQMVDLADLDLYSLRDNISSIMESTEFRNGHALLKHPEGFSPDYNILVNSKPAMLYAASRKNPFHTNYFYWIDLSYGRGENVYPSSCTWAPRRLMDDTDKVAHIMLNDVTCLASPRDLFKSDLPPFLSGGFFGGSKVGVARYYFLHRRVFLDLLRENLVDDDQTLAVACYFKMPEVFHLVRGWWHDAFSLFRQQTPEVQNYFKVPYSFY